MSKPRKPTEESEIDGAYRSLTGREPRANPGGTSCLGMVILGLFALALLWLLQFFLS